MKQEMMMMVWQRHQPDHMLIICTLLQTSIPSCSFSQPNTLPATQPIVSQRWFKSLDGKKNKKNLVVLNTLPVVVDCGQCIMLKTTSLCTVKKTAHTLHSHRSVRQIAREAHISRSSVRSIFKKDLQIGLNFLL